MDLAFRTKRLKSLLYWAGAFLFCIILFFCLPLPRFQKPLSTVLEDQNGVLLGASIARDGQWRFPEIDTVPTKFEQSILCFEDKHFYEHPGINPVSITRALYKNVKARKVTQGGSTLSMQTVRLSRDNPSRTFLEKCWEMLLALRLETGYSKKEILQLYASHAPFGGNVVGIEAASWRYFGRKPHQLSWGETALLAVLPNSPSLIYPGKNHVLLEKKRNKLLRTLVAQKVIDKTTCELAELEPLPQAPKPLPRIAPHLLDRFVLEGYMGNRIESTIQLQKQIRATALLQHYHEKLKTNSIHNGAILILDVQTGKTLAYVGNTIGLDPHLGHQVDIINSNRSYGSLLKPMLYATMLEEGALLPKMMVADIPTNIAGYRPHNFFKDYDGAVPANEVLSRSLNVPSVRLLHDHGVQRFHDLLRKSGISTLTFPTDHYGLSLILGGGESSLWELTGMYASLARTVLRANSSFARPTLFQDSSLHYLKEQPALGPASAFFALEAIAESKRPGNDGEWIDFASTQKIYWKTGTSYGSRDAWAIGVTAKYAVGVWLGNATGEGRAGLTGIGTAAPLLFDVFDFLDRTKPLNAPNIGVTYLPICQKSGFKASKHCSPVKEELVPLAGQKAAACPYHQLLHLDKTATFRVNSQCETVSDMQHKAWFVLPALQEWYYRPKHPSYRPMPAWRKDCEKIGGARNMDIIYPKRFAKIYIPREITGRLGMMVFEMAHRNPNATVYWHIDDSFLTETKFFHQTSLQIQEGWHTLTVVDDQGESIQVKFEVLEKAGR